MPDPRPSDPRPVDALTLEEAEAELARLAATLAEANQLVGTRGVNALVFNPQTETPLTTGLRDAATGAGVPVVDVTETLPAGQDYLTWLGGTRTELARALGAPA